jgi:hypothetical protein
MNGGNLSPMPHTEKLVAGVAQYLPAYLTRLDA